MNLSQTLYKKLLKQQPEEIALQLTGWGLLLATWVLLFGWLLKLLAGWELSWLLAASFVLTSLILLIDRLRQAGRDRIWLPWLFAAMNTIFFFLCLGLNGLGGWLLALSEFQFPVEGPRVLLICFLALNLFIFQSRVTMAPPASKRWPGLGLLVGLDVLIIGLIIGFPVIWAGLSWLDRLFYPYTPLIIIGFSLILALASALLLGGDEARGYISTE